MAEGYKKDTLFGKPKEEVIKRPGALHKSLGISASKKIPEKTLEKAASRKGRVGREARLAETMKSWHKG